MNGEISCRSITLKNTLQTMSIKITVSLEIEIVIPCYQFGNSVKNERDTTKHGHRIVSCTVTGWSRSDFVFSQQWIELHFLAAACSLQILKANIAGLVLIR